MNFTINDIANFLGVDRGFVRRFMEANEVRPTKKIGEEMTYTFFQIILFRPLLEQLGQNDIYIDIEQQEIYSIIESKL